jgi:hypothetical protein
MREIIIRMSFCERERRLSPPTAAMLKLMKLKMLIYGSNVCLYLFCCSKVRIICPNTLNKTMKALECSTSEACFTT